MHAHEIHTLHLGCAAPRMRLLAAMLASGALLTSTAALADGTDNCPGADITVLPFNDTGTTIGANNTVTAIPAGCSNYTTNAGPDKIYQLVIATAGSLTVTVTPDAGSGYDTSIYLLNDAVFACPAGTGSTAPAGSCVAGSDAGLTNIAESFTVPSLAAGTYHLYVDSFYSTGSAGSPNRHNGPFTLAITGTAVLGGGTSADLSITKDDGVSTVTAGSSTTYTIIASNAGPGDVTGATVTDNFPAACTSVSYTSVAAGGASGNTASGSGNINDTALNLPSGSSVTYTATCNIAAGGTGSLSNTATISSATDDPNPNNNSATDIDTIVLPPPEQANLSVTLTDAPDPVNVGDTITYTATVSNAGPDAAENVDLNVPLPAEVAFASITPGTATCTTPAVGVSGTVNCDWTSIGASGGATVVITATATAPSATGGSGAVATATVDSDTDDPNTANNSATTFTTINAAGPGPGGGDQPVVATVPTLGSYATALLGALLGLLGVAAFRRRS